MARGPIVKLNRINDYLACLQLGRLEYGYVANRQGGGRATPRSQNQRKGAMIVLCW
jgi:hypothetical protein